MSLLRLDETGIAVVLFRPNLAVPLLKSQLKMDMKRRTSGTEQSLPLPPEKFVRAEIGGT